jgi:hypothetical protein
MFTVVNMTRRGRPRKGSFVAACCDSIDIGVLGNGSRTTDIGVLGTVLKLLSLVS